MPKIIIIKAMKRKNQCIKGCRVNVQVSSVIQYIDRIKIFEKEIYYTNSKTLYRTHIENIRR